MSKTQPATEERSKGVSDVFPNGFSEFWHFTRHLTKSQRDILFGSLSPLQRKKINSEIHKGGWIDVIARCNLSAFVDHIEKEYDFNLIDMRCKVLRGKSVYLPRPVWEYVIMELEEYMTQHKNIIVGGIRSIVCKQNPDVILLVREDSQTQE